MNRQELTDLILAGTPVSLITEAIQWPHQAMRHGWNLTNWHVIAQPAGILFYQTEAPAAPATPVARRLREAEAERKRITTELGGIRRTGRQYFEAREEDSRLQYQLNDLDREISNLKLQPGAPPEVRSAALASAIANQRRRAESLRDSAAMYRHNASATGSDVHLEALAASEENDATEATSEAERLQQELDSIAVPKPVAGIVLINADEQHREEYEQVATEAGYPCTVLLRGQWNPGPVRTFLDAIVDGVLR